MQRGKKTAHPGVRLVSANEYFVRATLLDDVSRMDRHAWVKGTLEDAVRARAELKAAVRRESERAAKNRALGVDDPGAKDETLAQYAKRWIVHLARSGRNRPHTLEQHIRVLNSFILPSIGDLELHKLTPRDLVNWMEDLGDHNSKQGKPYAKLTLASVWATLRTSLKDALVLADMQRDVTRGIRFRVRGNEPMEKDVLTRDELGRVLDETQHESADIRTMIWVGFTTGMRFGELSALEWSDVDFESGIIHVRKSQVNGNVGPTKTRTRRTVPLHSVVGEILRAHAQWQKERQRAEAASGFLFLPKSTRELGEDTTRVERRLRHSSVLTKPLTRCAERAGVKKHVTSHTMRRTFNNLARQAAGEIVARSMTGHTSTAMTEHYSHVTLDEKNKAIAEALGLLGPRDGSPS